MFLDCQVKLIFGSPSGFCVVFISTWYERQIFSAVPGGERWTCLNFCFVGPTRYKQSEGGGDGDDVRKFNARWLHKISGNQKIRKSGHNRWRQSVVGQNKAFLRFCCKHKSQFYGISTQLGQQQQQQQQPKVDRFWYVLLAAELPH